MLIPKSSASSSFPRSFQTGPSPFAELKVYGLSWILAFIGLSMAYGCGNSESESKQFYTYDREEEVLTLYEPILPQTPQGSPEPGTSPTLGFDTDEPKPEPSASAPGPLQIRELSHFCRRYNCQRVVPGVGQVGTWLQVTGLAQPPADWNPQVGTSWVVRDQVIQILSVGSPTRTGSLLLNVQNRGTIVYQ